jgi:capsular exopolysaccharide synthesis family protein
MPDQKPIPINRERYPELIYPAPVAPPPAQIDLESERDEMSLLDFWRVLVVRRWTILAVFVTAVVFTLISTLKETPIYQASTTLQIDRENPNVLPVKGVYEVDNTADDTLPTQYKILESRSLARKVIEELRLDRVEEFASKPKKPGLISSYLPLLTRLFRRNPTDSPSDEPDYVRPIIDAYLGNLSVRPVRQARLVEVSFESPNPKLAADIINAHAKYYKEQNLQFKWDATQDASNFLQEQLSTLRANLEKAEDKLQAYSREKQILFTDEGKNNTATEKLKQLEAEYTKAQTERFEKEAYSGLIRLGSADSLPQLTNDALIANLTSKLADLRKEESDIAVTFSPEYPRRKRLRNQIEEIQRAIDSEKTRVIQTVEADYSASVERERLTRDALEQQRSVVNNQNQESIQYTILKREADSFKQLYDGLQTRLREAQVSAGLRASNIRVVDPAEIPRSPVRPRRLLNLMLGSLLGLSLGIGLAFFQEYLDSSLKSPDDVQRFLKVPSLGTIPNMQSLGKGRPYAYGSSKFPRQEPVARGELEKTPAELITHTAPSSVMAEAYRSVRTSLLLSLPERAPRVVLVTSAVPSEGKTVTAINLAVSLTQTGSRVVLVDADMRKPRIHSVFSIGNLPGLTSFLTGSANLKDVIHDVGPANLHLLPCGVVPPNPAELIQSGRFNHLVQVLRQYFDYVVFDSPPLANVSDARILAANAEATLLVVKAFSTSRHMAKRAVEHLQELKARNIAVILNDLDVRIRGSYSYYSDRYYYTSKHESMPSA